MLFTEQRLGTTGSIEYQRTPIRCWWRERSMRFSHRSHDGFIDEKTSMKDLLLWYRVRVETESGYRWTPGATQFAARARAPTWPTVDTFTWKSSVDRVASGRALEDCAAPEGPSSSPACGTIRVGACTHRADTGTDVPLMATEEVVVDLTTTGTEVD